MLKIANLCLDDLKKSFVENNEWKKCSATLVFALCDYYVPESKSFQLYSETCLTFCSREAVEVLGMEDLGNDIAQFSPFCY